MRKLIKLLNSESALETVGAIETIGAMARPLVMIVLIGYMHFIYLSFQDIRFNLTYNVDHARNKFMNETRFMFRRGCEAGQEYNIVTKPGEYSVYPLATFCADQFKEFEQYVSDQSMELGTKQNKFRDQ